VNHVNIDHRCRGDDCETCRSQEEMFEQLRQREGALMFSFVLPPDEHGQFRGFVHSPNLTLLRRVQAAVWKRHHAAGA